MLTQQNGAVLGYAAEELKVDKEVVMEAATQDGDDIGYASEMVTADKEVVTAAIKTNHDYALMWALEELEVGEEVVVGDCRGYGKAPGRASD